MSAHTIPGLLFTCDDADCDSTVRSTGIADPPTARREIAGLGWQTRPGSGVTLRDYCPEHSRG